MPGHYRVTINNIIYDIAPYNVALNSKKNHDYIRTVRFKGRQNIESLIHYSHIKPSQNTNLIYMKKQNPSSKSEISFIVERGLVIVPVLLFFDTRHVCIAESRITVLYEIS